MRTTVADMVRIMETIAPVSLAEEWDNVGLQVGDMRWPVAKIWIALDPTPEVVSAACENRVDLLITHHPLIFKPLTTIDFGSLIGSIIHQAGSRTLAIFAAHTNLDNAKNGLNDILAGKIGLTNVQVLAPVDPQNRFPRTVDHGTGRIGDLSSCTTLASLADGVTNLFGGGNVKLAGDPGLHVEKVAVCSGSGSSLMNAFMASGAQVFISGDLRYHDARRVEQAGLAMIDIGHFASEWIVVDELTGRLKKVCAEQNIDVVIEACTIEKDPFWSLAGQPFGSPDHP